MMKRILNRFLLINSLMILSTLVKAQDLETVRNVDLSKYMGKWYEIASYPKSFQKNCYGTTAEYIMTNNDYVTVINRCRKGSLQGKEKTVKGKATAVEGTNNAKLKVKFFFLFSGNYWIIDLADDYSYAVVSEPKRKSLWILSRTPKISQDTYSKILSRIKSKGFDLDKLQMTVQE
jgi:apolipoprotein D and lipocalin family protein